MEMEFREYLVKKKIDPELFQQNEPETFGSFKSLFEQMHPNSFTMQKLFLINIIRRKYQLAATDKKLTETGKAKVKPVVKKTVQPKEGDTVEKRSAKPVMRKPAVTSEESTDDSSKKVKPVMKRPVMKPKIKPKEAEDVKSAAPKPKKPVVRPKIKPKEKDNFKPTAKPIMKKPVVKPKITPKPKKEEDVEKEVKASSKPIMKKPVIKPKIQPRKNKEE